MGEPRPGPDPSKSNHQTQVEASPAVAGRVTAIVTAFRPEASLIEHCRLLKEQVAEVVVVDDGSGPEFDNVLSRIEVQGVSVIRLPENAGIANAINHGYKWSETISSELVITFDQDSRVTPGFIAKLV